MSGSNASGSVLGVHIWPEQIGSWALSVVPNVEPPAISSFAVVPHVVAGLTVDLQVHPGLVTFHRHVQHTRLLVGASANAASSGDSNPSSAWVHSGLEARDHRLFRVVTGVGAGRRFNGPGVVGRDRADGSHQVHS